MLYNMKCSRPDCNCREFYLVFDGFNIQQRCKEGHYNKHISKKVYKQLIDAGYEDIEDRTGLSVEKPVYENVVSLNEYNLKDTVNGDTALRQLSGNNKSKTKSYNTFTKTGTTNSVDYHLLDDLEVY